MFGAYKLASERTQALDRGDRYTPVLALHRATPARATLARATPVLHAIPPIIHHYHLCGIRDVYSVLREHSSNILLKYSTNLRRLHPRDVTC